MRSVRQSIIEGRFPDFVRSFMLAQYPAKDYPGWVVDALRSVEIELL